MPNKTLFIEELRAALTGEVYDDPLTCRVYSVDASIFEVEPLCIALPKTLSELIQAVKIAHHHRVALTVRGAATGITGGCLGKGIILDVSKYLNKILEINSEARYAICEPGVVQDDLNNALSVYGLRLGPDTSTGNRATLGGMVGNNAAGARSLRFGCMVDHVISVDLLIASGEVISFSSVTEAEWLHKRSKEDAEGRIYRAVYDIQKRYRNEIEQHTPKIPRQASGYHLSHLIEDEPLNLERAVQDLSSSTAVFRLNVAKLIVGSEGTLGIVTKVKVRIVPKLQATGLLLFFFEDLNEAFSSVSELLSHHPLSLELIDEQIVQLGRASPSLKGKLDWLQGDPKAVIAFELEGEDPEAVKQKLSTLKESLKLTPIGYQQVMLSDPLQIENVWTLRKSGLGILLSKRTYNRAIAFIEDISVSPYQLAPFMKKFCAYLESKGKSAGIYGHVGSGCMHVRPYINLLRQDEFDLMKQMMEDVSSMILEFGGAMSGEHGDGFIRSWLNPKMFGEKLMQAFSQLKNAFDPEHLMNPGKIIPLQEKFESLRTEPDEVFVRPTTFLNFKPEGGFELAVDLCNGNGLCRKKENVMCPSFQVTNEEFHSTRARAEALRGIIHGHLPIEDFTSQRMHDVMDLCLSCKGCKTECPSQVDMAKMKAEFLYHYQEKWGYSLRSRLFASIGKLNQWMSHLPKFVNWLNQTRLGKYGLKKLGIAPQRNLPKLGVQRFSKWFESYVQTKNLSKSVVLFNDTFNEFNHPEIGQAAVNIFNQLGYKVIVPPWNCCGRPAISKGLLKMARGQAEKLLDVLLPYALQGLPIIGLEPSCILTLKDDYIGVVTENDAIHRKIDLVANLCFTFDQFLNQLAQKGEFNLSFKAVSKQIKVHGHCHQKALLGMKPTMALLKTIPGFQVSEIQSGCCGMAGSFGYEKEHYAISMGIGELRLFPAVRESDEETIIVADGMSCRHQIFDGTKRLSSHLAEVLQQHLQNID